MLENVPYRHDWAYILEADERMMSELFAECLGAIAQSDAQNDTPNAPVAYYVAERVMFMGTWIRRSTQFPRYHLRLPLRPLARWLYMMLILGGWRDGRAGLAWCTLQAFYEYLIVLKVRELMHPEH